MYSSSDGNSDAPIEAAENSHNFRGALALTRCETGSYTAPASRGILPCVS
jgi:hypothetical protein